jgi:hypothetical protein
MAAVVENDIGRTEFLNDRVQERWICLISDTDIDLIFGKRSAGRVYVDTDNAGMRS